MAREMKNSGIEWIGDIPSEWETDRLQWHLEEIKVQNSPVQSEQVLSLTIEAGVIPYEDKGNQGNKAKENYEEYKLAYPDTLVVNSMNVIIGAVGISKYFGCVSPVYYVFKATKDTDLRYIYYLFTNIGFQKEMRKYAKGILEIRLRISSADMLKRIVPKPSFDEQKRIADFLDSKCAEIDTVIENTKATIEEYKKLKRTVITEAVTKGIRGDRIMKDSGIEWIGNIPSEWENRKMLSILSMRVIDGPHESPELYDEGIPYISANAIENGKIDFSKMRGYISEEYCEQCDKRYKPQKNDILVIKLGATTGQIALVDTEERFNIWVPLAAIRCNNLALPKFVYYAMQSNYYIRQIENSWTYGTQQTLGVKTIERLRIVIPDLDEQKEIADFLDRKCSKFDKLIADKTHLLEELESYKKSVIYEYVTGKKEVK